MSKPVRTITGTTVRFIADFPDRDLVVTATGALAVTSGWDPATEAEMLVATSAQVVALRSVIDDADVAAVLTSRAQRVVA